MNGSKISMNGLKKKINESSLVAVAEWSGKMKSLLMRFGI